MAWNWEDFAENVGEGWDNFTEAVGNAGADFIEGLESAGEGLADFSIGLGNYYYDVIHNTRSEEGDAWITNMTGHNPAAEKELIANLDKVDLVLTSLKNIRTNTIDTAREEVRESITELNNVEGLSEYDIQVNTNTFDSIFDEIEAEVLSIEERLQTQVDAVTTYQNSSIFTKYFGTAKTMEGLATRTIFGTLENVADFGLMTMGVTAYGQAWVLERLGLAEKGTAQERLDIMAGLAKINATEELFDWDGYFNEFNKYSAITSDSSEAKIVETATTVGMYLLGGECATLVSGHAGTDILLGQVGKNALSQNVLSFAIASGVIGGGSGFQRALNEGKSSWESVGEGLKEGGGQAAIALALGMAAENSTAIGGGSEPVNVESANTEPQVTETQVTEPLNMTEAEAQQAYSEAVANQNAALRNGTQAELDAANAELERATANLNQVRANATTSIEQVPETVVEGTTAAPTAEVTTETPTLEDIRPAAEYRQQKFDEYMRTGSDESFAEFTEAANNELDLYSELRAANTPTAEVKPETVPTRPGGSTTVDTARPGTAGTAEVTTETVPASNPSTEVASGTTTTSSELQTAQQDLEAARQELINANATGRTAEIEEAQLNYDRAYSRVEELSTPVSEAATTSTAENVLDNVVNTVGENNISIIPNSTNAPAALINANATVENNRISAEATRTGGFIAGRENNGVEPQYLFTKKRGGDVIPQSAPETSPVDDYTQPASDTTGDGNYQQYNTTPYSGSNAIEYRTETVESTPEPTPTPTSSPTPSPTPTPSPQPIHEPEPGPTPEPTPESTPTPGPTPGPTPSTQPQTGPSYNNGVYYGTESSNNVIEELTPEVTNNIKDSVLRGGKPIKIPTSSEIPTVKATQNKNNSVIPIVAGIGAAAAAGIGAKAYLDRKNNNDNDEYNDEIRAEEWTDNDNLNLEYEKPKQETEYLDDEYTYETQPVEKYDAKENDELEGLE